MIFIVHWKFDFSVNIPFLQICVKFWKVFGVFSTLKKFLTFVLNLIISFISFFEFKSFTSGLCRQRSRQNLIYAFNLYSTKKKGPNLMSCPLCFKFRTFSSFVFTVTLVTVPNQWFQSVSGPNGIALKFNCGVYLHVSNIDVLILIITLTKCFNDMISWVSMKILDSAGEYVISWAKISSTMMLCCNVIWITNSRCHSPFQSPVCFLHECMLWTWFNNWSKNCSPWLMTLKTKHWNFW